jgi:insulysin
LKQVQLDVFVHGNASLQEAKDAAEMIQSAFHEMGSEALPEVTRKKVTKLPTGKTTIFEYDLAAENPAQENCCTQNVYQVGSSGTEPEDFKRDACLIVVCQVAGTSAYQQLRTEEQLGYIVQAGFWSEAHVVGMSVLVQGTRMTPTEADARIEDWLAKFGKQLEDMADEEFDQIVEGIVKNRTQRYARLAQETSLHWGEIAPRRYQFDCLKLGVEALEVISKADVLDFFAAYFPASAPTRRKLSMRVLGTSAGDARSEPVDGGEVLRGLEDLRTFRSASEYFLSPEHKDMPRV